MPGGTTNYENGAVQVSVFWRAPSHITGGVIRLYCIARSRVIQYRLAPDRGEFRRSDGAAIRDSPEAAGAAGMRRTKEATDCHTL
jgi:hypothetical protein